MGKSLPRSGAGWARAGLYPLREANGEFRVARNEADLTSTPFASGMHELDGNTVALAEGATPSGRRAFLTANCTSW